MNTANGNESYFMVVQQDGEAMKYEVGEEMDVKCVSFSTKGIPVVALTNSD